MGEAQTVEARSDGPHVLFVFRTLSASGAPPAPGDAEVEGALVHQLLAAWSRSAGVPLEAVELSGFRARQSLPPDSPTAMTLQAVQGLLGLEEVAGEPAAEAAPSAAAPVEHVLILALWPLPRPVVRSMHAGLAAQLPGTYLGAIQLASLEELHRARARLGRSDSLRIRQGRCEGAWHAAVPPIPLRPPPPPLTGWGPQPEGPRLRQAWIKIIIALVLAPLSLVACNVLCIPAVILAGIALSELRRVEEVPGHYRVLAIVAIVLGGLGLLLLLGTVVFMVVMMVRQGTWP